VTRNAGSLEIFDTPNDVAAALANRFMETGREAIAQRGAFTVSLAGGTTPKAAYALLAHAPSDALDWGKVQIYFGDERCVPPDDDQSNYKMAREAFLDAVKIPSWNVHRIRAEEEPAKAAEWYRDALVAAFGNQPRFDLVMLGMGPDGHTASLFPGTDPMTNDAALVRAVYSESQSQWRITLTPAVLNGARAVVFAVEGAGKTAMLHTVREGPYDPSAHPSQIVAPSDGTLTWLVDKAAAGA